MNLTLEQGRLCHLNPCVESLQKSALGEHYFSSEGSAKSAVLEGIRQGTLYTAVTEGECVGFFYYLPKGAFHSFPYLHLFAVKEAYRNKGIGGILLQRFEKLAFDCSDKAFLVVADFNPAAKRFYESNGYRQVGELPSLYRAGITEYLMMKQAGNAPQKTL